jgi:N-acetylglucosamine kinase-like BadF-type ATPase
LDIARSVLLVSDADVAFEDAFGGGEGILLIAGSGSIGLARALAETGEHSLRRVGGWGALLGDEGSGYGIGLAGLRAAVAGSEGRGPETHLLNTLYEILNLDAVRALFEWSETADKPAVAALAPSVVEVAREGDPVAGQIVEEAVRGLIAHATALRGRYFFDSPAPSVALVGGLIQDGGPLRSQVRRALESDGFEVLDAPVVPVRGAARMAQRLSAAEGS